MLISIEVLRDIYVHLEFRHRLKHTINQNKYKAGNSPPLGDWQHDLFIEQNQRCVSLSVSTFSFPHPLCGCLIQIHNRSQTYSFILKKSNCTAAVAGKLWSVSSINCTGSCVICPMFAWKIPKKKNTPVTAERLGSLTWIS